MNLFKSVEICVDEVIEKPNEDLQSSIVQMVKEQNIAHTSVLVYLRKPRGSMLYSTWADQKNLLDRIGICKSLFKS